MLRTAAKLLPVFCVAGILAAQPGPGRPGGFGGPGGPGGFGGPSGATATDTARPQQDWSEVKAKLNLSDQQVTALTNLQSTFRQASQTIFEQIQEKEKAIRTEMERTQPNAGVVGQLMIDAKNLRAQIKTKHEDLNKQAVALLNDQQKAALADLQKAVALMPAIRQAMALNLLTPPADALQGRGMSHAGPGMMFRGRPGAARR